MSYWKRLLIQMNYLLWTYGFYLNMFLTSGEKNTTILEY